MSLKALLKLFPNLTGKSEAWSSPGRGSFYAHSHFPHGPAWDRHCPLPCCPGREARTWLQREPSHPFRRMDEGETKQTNKNKNGPSVCGKNTQPLYKQPLHEALPLVHGRDTERPLVEAPFDVSRVVSGHPSMDTTPFSTYF